MFLRKTIKICRGHENSFYKKKKKEKSKLKVHILNYHSDLHSTGALPVCQI